MTYLVHSTNELTGARVCHTDGFVEWDVQRFTRTRVRKHHCGLVASYGRFDHGDMNVKLRCWHGGRHIPMLKQLPVVFVSSRKALNPSREIHRTQISASF